MFPYDSDTDWATFLSLPISLACVKLLSSITSSSPSYQSPSVRSQSKISSDGCLPLPFVNSGFFSKNIQTNKQTKVLLIIPLDFPPLLSTFILKKQGPEPFSRDETFLR